jgi:hypothetical protein
MSLYRVPTHPMQPIHWPWKDLTPEDGWPETPLTGLVDGPLVGGEWEAGDPTPRSITVDYWNIVCPASERYLITSDEIKVPVRDAEGSEIFHRAVQMISNAPARCVEITPSPRDPRPQIYDMDLVVGPRSLSASKILLNSSTSRLLRSSTVVNTALEKNMHLFTATASPAASSVPHGTIRSNTNESTNIFKRMLAVHVRRGDFDIKLCYNRADWAWTYYQWRVLNCFKHT